MDVVVIGGGASPRGRGLGSRINAADAVVRVWDCDWQFETPEDYGERWDYGAVVVNGGPQFQGWSPRRHLTPDTWWAILLVERYRPVFSSIVEATRFDFAHLSELSNRITPDSHARPMISRGAAMAIAAMSLKPDRITMVGMDNLRNGKMTRSAHKPVNPGRQNKRSAGRYDCVADANLIKHLAMESNIELVYD